MFMDSIRLTDFHKKIQTAAKVQLTDFIFLELNIFNENNVTKIYLALHKKKNVRLILRRGWPLKSERKNMLEWLIYILKASQSKMKHLL